MRLGNYERSRELPIRRIVLPVFHLHPRVSEEEVIYRLAQSWRSRLRATADVVAVIILREVAFLVFSLECDLRSLDDSFQA